MSYIGGFFRGAWTVLKVAQTLLLTLLLLVLLVAYIGLVTGGKQPPSIPGGGAALVIEFDGGIVERKSLPNPRSLLLGEAPTILLRDLVRGIDTAAKDNRITTVVLDLSGFNGALPATLHYVGQKLDGLKAAGKKVIATADNYSQEAYLIATHADEIHMHPFGTYMPTGYSRYRMFYKDLLDRLDVTVNNFSVGQYKSAGEPYFRSDMSEAAKESNRAWLGIMWKAYISTVDETRGLTGGGFAAFVDNMVEGLKLAQGDMAAYARDAKLVDSLKTHDELDAYLKDLVGADKKGESYKKIGLRDYLQVVNGPAYAERSRNNKPKIAIVLADGMIIMGDQDAGVASSNAVSKLLREARDDETIKAVVFRVNSPGGSPQASEIIRREVQLIRDAGKPVVVSMAGVAASGGYWISMSADEVFASPTTITGSIGVAGFFTTFENTIKLIGVNVDGVGTTDLAGTGTFGEPLNEKMISLVQLMVEDIYNKFLNLVADARNMPRERVEELAQGRVWAGSAAKDLGLVDELGNLDDAIASAAKRANLTEYEIRYVEREPSDIERFLASLMGSSVMFDLQGLGRSSALVRKVLDMADTAERDLLLSDPNHVYAICGTCMAN